MFKPWQNHFLMANLATARTHASYQMPSLVHADPADNRNWR